MNFLQRVLGVVVAVALAAAALVFASIVLALAAAIALVLGGWLWWRTRQLRRQNAANSVRRADGTVIEGEYRVEREVHTIDQHER